MKDIKEIEIYLHSAGVKSKTHNLRITSHPGDLSMF